MYTDLIFITKRQKFFFVLLGLFCFSLLQATMSYAENTKQNLSKQDLECANLLTETVFEDNDSALKTTGRFVTSGGHPIYFEFYSHPEATETLVITNGLSYELKEYEELVRLLLKKRPINVLVSEYRVQSDEKTKNYNSSWAGLTTDHFVDDLIELTRFLQIEEPFHLAGLSFGSSVAAQLATRFPAKVKSVTFIAPLIKLAEAFELHLWLDAFNIFYSAKTKALLATVTEFDLSKIELLQPTAVVLAEREFLPLLKDQEEYVKEAIRKQRPLKVFTIKGSEHAIPSSKPEELARIFEDLIFKE